MCARAYTKGVIIEYVDTFEPEKGQPSPQNATSFRLCTVPSNQEYFVLTTRGFSSTLIVRSTSRFPRLILNYLRATVRLYLTESFRDWWRVSGLHHDQQPILLTRRNTWPWSIHVVACTIGRRPRGTDRQHKPFGR